MQKILVVDDDRDINNLIFEALTKSGYECVQAFSGTEALLLAQNAQLIVLDLMLPGCRGEDVLSTLRSGGIHIPVIVLSAKDALESKIDLLNMGAEDYLTKPFEVAELIARVGVQLRRSITSDETVPSASSEANTSPSLHGQSLKPSHPPALRHKSLELDSSAFSAKLSGELLNLTKLEYRILELLMSHPKRAFSKQEIFDYAWEDHYIGEDKTIHVHVSNIRKKIKAVSDDEYIETVWGIGFRLAR